MLYCNIGSAFAAYIVEIVSIKIFNNFIKKIILIISRCPTSIDSFPIKKSMNRNLYNNNSNEKKLDKIKLYGFKTYRKAD